MVVPNSSPGLLPKNPDLLKEGVLDLTRNPRQLPSRPRFTCSDSDTYLATTLFPKLGIAEAIAGKTRKVLGPPSGEPVAAAIARGEAEIGFQQVSELIHTTGVTFVGTQPEEVQPPIFFSGAPTGNAREPEAAAALLRFLSSAEAASVIKEAGLYPVGGK
jgi:molybdate transport system substrate-binding protein